MWNKRPRIWFFVKFWGAKVSMHSWRGHALNTVRVLFVACVNVQDPITKALKIAQTK